MRACGVDGYKSGWFYFELSNDKFYYGVCITFSDILIKVHKSKRVLVDIPIGLPSARQSPRLCDIQARKLLGPRRSSVFSAPIREIIDIQTYDQANLNSKQLTGKGLSKQTFNIIPKIVDLDRILQKKSQNYKHVREAHPELCFMSLAKGNPMYFNKKTQEGSTERVRILSEYWIPAELAIEVALTRFGRIGVAKDDIVDALALAIVASHSEYELASIPKEIQYDEFGLPMEMVYLSF